MGGVKFGVTADGQPGYKKDGADTVYPFSSIVNLYKGMLPLTLLSCSATGGAEDSVPISQLTLPIDNITKINFKMSGYAHNGVTYTIQSKKDTAIIDNWSRYSFQEINESNKEINCKGANILYCKIQFNVPGGVNNAIIQITDIS